MKVVILAGGFGTRISEESAVRPKPMVEIGGRPILWHIMKIYSAHGLNEFVICGGYKFDIIRSYFWNYRQTHSDVTLDLKNDRIEVHNCDVEPWSVTLVDTGEQTMTGGRVKRIRKYLDGEPFCLTYGDGVADIDIKALVSFHQRAGGAATMTVVSPPGRFGVVSIDNDRDRIDAFREKSNRDVGFINGGFFVLDPEVHDYIAGDETVWEREPLDQLVRDGKVAAYRHTGFWQNMDTLRDKNVLESLWQSGHPPWKIW